MNRVPSVELNGKMSYKFCAVRSRDMILSKDVETVSRPVYNVLVLRTDVGLFCMLNTG